jgi:RND family efflux transporter MFP subunit
MKRLILPLLAIAAVVYATMSIVRNKPVLVKSEPPSPPPASVFSHTIAAVGILEPNSEAVAIGTPLGGVIEKILVQVGESVKEGDPLFQLDARHLQAALEVRKAALDSAQAKVQTAETMYSDVADQLDRAQKLGGSANVISADELMRRRFARQVAEARLAEAKAEVGAAQAELRATETDLERSVIRAPMDAEVIQLKVRVGEYAPAGQTTQPMLVLGKLHPMHVRVDVDEHEGWRVRAAANATAHVRGNADLQTPLKFVRVEPMVVPKRSLSGDSTERVDTRVLQVIYEISDPALQVYVGQQMDIFIDDILAREKNVAMPADNVDPIQATQHRAHPVAEVPLRPE